MPNFDEISLSTVEIKLLPVFKQTTVILEFYFRFDFDVCAVIGISF